MSRRIATWEEGQALIIMALAMVVLLGFLALAVDGGNAYAQHRRAQNAADAGALAGAQALVSGGNVQAAIYEYAGRNGVDLSDPASILWSYVGGGGGNTGVVVTTTVTFPTFFAKVIDLSEMAVMAMSEARVVSVPGGGGYAIWGHDDSDSKAAHFSGSNVTVNGGVHSNAGVHSTGVNLTVLGLLDYVTGWQRNGSNLWIGNSPYESWPCSGCNLWVGDPPPGPTTVQPMPVDYEMGAYQPGGSAAQTAQDDGKYYNHGGSWSISGQNYHVPSGLHYVNGNVHFSGSNVFFDQGPVTIVSTGYIRISGCNLLDEWTPYSGGLTLFSTYSGSNAIKTAGSNSGTNGIIYAPNSDIEYAGSNSMNGGIIGDKVKITGSNAVIRYESSYFPSEQTIRLVQ